MKTKIYNTLVKIESKTNLKAVIHIEIEEEEKAKKCM